GDLEVVVVAAPEVDVRAAGADDRVVGARAGADLADDVTAARVDDAPETARGELARGHEDPRPVAADRHAVDPARIGPVPHDALGHQVVLEQRAVAVAAPVAALADVERVRARVRRHPADALQ